MPTSLAIQAGASQTSPPKDFERPCRDRSHSAWGLCAPFCWEAQPLQRHQYPVVHQEPSLLPCGATAKRSGRRIATASDPGLRISRRNRLRLRAWSARGSLVRTGAGKPIGSRCACRSTCPGLLTTVMKLRRGTAPTGRWSRNAEVNGRPSSQSRLRPLRCSILPKTL